MTEKTSFIRTSTVSRMLFNPDDMSITIIFNDGEISHKQFSFKNEYGCWEEHAENRLKEEWFWF
jgi:hypothetical protein